jgi:hypothetical protein
MLVLDTLVWAHVKYSIVLSLTPVVLSFLSQAQTQVQLYFLSDKLLKFYHSFHLGLPARLSIVLNGLGLPMLYAAAELAARKLNLDPKETNLFSCFTAPLHLLLWKATVSDSLPFYT